MVVQPAIPALPVLVALPDEIDVTNARDVRRQLSAVVLRPGVMIVIADMTATRFCDSMGCRALLMAHQRAVQDQTELRLLRPGPGVMRGLQLLGLDKEFAIYESFEEAVTP